MPVPAAVPREREDSNGPVLKLARWPKWLSGCGVADHDGCCFGRGACATRTVVGGGVVVGALQASFAVVGCRTR